MPHSLDQNFICSIWCVDYNGVNDAGRFIYSLSGSLLLSISYVCVRVVHYVHHEIFESSQTTMHRMVGEAKVGKYLPSSSSVGDLHVAAMLHPEKHLTGRFFAHWWRDRAICYTTNGQMQKAATSLILHRHRSRALTSTSVHVSFWKANKQWQGRAWKRAK